LAQQPQSVFPALVSAPGPAIRAATAGPAVRVVGTILAGVARRGLSVAVAAGLVISGAIWSGLANADEPAPESTAESATKVRAVQSAPISAPIDELTDVQLTDLAADWQQLDAAARADLIAETRERMQPGQAQGPQARATAAAGSRTPQNSHPQNTPLPQVTVRTERRRYGRVVRQPDGSLVRIETQVVRVQRSDPKRAFGVGFERRQRQYGPGSTEAQDSVQGEATTTDRSVDTPRQDVLVVSETLD